MSVEKPTILFVPGAWHGPEGFDVTRQQLESLGYPTEAVSLPSVGAEPPNKTLLDDTTVVRTAIEKLAEEDKKIVVLAHSYAGIVGSCAVEDLDYAHRKSAGKRGGVINLIYLAAFALPKGLSLFEAVGGKPLPWMDFQGEYYNIKTPGEIFYNDLSPAEQEKWIAQLTHTSAAVAHGKSTYEPWHDIPCTYIFCEKDNALPYSVQQDLARSMGPQTTIFSIDASHSPFLSQPAKLVEGIELAAKVGLEKSQ